ncbi:TPM domain-containing protein, partial [Pseudomonadales bacterium]|nr:TPM domain-containing protein [Pseudomonadales bacterium]
MKGFILAVLLLGLSLPAHSADLVFPKLTGRVVDEAGLISAGDQRLINAASRRLEQTSGHQLVVVTVKDLQGVVIE